MPPTDRESSKPSLERLTIASITWDERYGATTLQQFFDEVAQPNAQEALENHADLRRMVNAIMTLDALFGITHAELRRLGTADLPDRDDHHAGCFHNSPATCRPSVFLEFEKMLEAGDSVMFIAGYEISHNKKASEQKG